MEFVSGMFVSYLFKSNFLSNSGLSIPGFIKIDSRQRPWWWGGPMENERDALGLEKAKLVNSYYTELRNTQFF